MSDPVRERLAETARTHLRSALALHERLHLGDIARRRAELDTETREVMNRLRGEIAVLDHLRITWDEAARAWPDEPLQVPGEFKQWVDRMRRADPGYYIDSPPRGAAAQEPG